MVVFIIVCYFLLNSFYLFFFVFISIKTSCKCAIKETGYMIVNLRVFFVLFAAFLFKTKKNYKKLNSNMKNVQLNDIVYI